MMIPSQPLFCDGDYFATKGFPSAIVAEHGLNHLNQVFKVITEIGQQIFHRVSPLQLFKMGA